jgi:hypothetical protein
MQQSTKDMVSAIKDKMRITKVVCTRSVKGKWGDSFAGFSAAWDSVQEDGAHGLEDVGDSKVPQQAMTLKEAKIASYMLAMQADISAYQHSWAGGNIPKSACDDAIRNIRINYLQLITEAAEGKGAQQAAQKETTK